MNQDRENANRIVLAEAWHLALPMNYDLRIGPITYRTRDYVVLRLTDDEGHQGVGVGYTRGTALLPSVMTIVEQLDSLGADPASVHRTLQGRFAPGWAGMIRAAAIVDIALWDIQARRAGRPMWAMFGEAPRQVPLMVVAGYFMDIRGQSAILDEIDRFVAEGYQTMKVIVGGSDVAADAALVAAIAGRVPASIDIAIDVHGAFKDPSDAVSYAEAFVDLPIAFIEDPCPNFDVAELCEVARRSPLPIATGEDLISVSAYRQLVASGVSLLRIDATSIGGYTPALTGVGIAADANVRVAPHVWPHVHMPLAAASELVSTIEVIPAYVSADPLMGLLAEPLPILAGTWQAPDVPGLHLPLDWDRVAAIATTSTTHRF